MAEHDKKMKVVIRRPNGLLYWILIPFAKLVSHALFHIEVHKSPEVKALKSPFVAIGTHSCAMDVAFMLSSLMPIRTNIVCGRDVYSWKIVKPIFDAAGLIPISQFDMDISSIRLMKKAVQKKCSLALFPEGKISMDGRPLHYMSPSLAKLLKFLDVPVVMVHNNGGYSSRPRWFKMFKRGKVVQETTLLFTQEELRTLDKDIIFARLKQAYQFNDNIFQQENHIKFRSRTPALGLHYILYKCPKCGMEYEMRSTKKHLICDACNNTVEYTQYGEFIPQGDSVTFDRLDKWYDYEKDAVKKEINQEGFYISKPVVWEMQDKDTHIYYEKGEGELYINSEVIGFNGTDLKGTPAEISCYLKNLTTVVQKLEEGIDLTIEGVIHRFYFREVKYSAKYNLIVEESFRKIHGLD